MYWNEMQSVSVNIHRTFHRTETTSLSCHLFSFFPVSFCLRCFCMGISCCCWHRAGWCISVTGIWTAKQVNKNEPLLSFLFPFQLCSGCCPGLCGLDIPVGSHHQPHWPWFKGFLIKLVSLWRKTLPCTWFWPDCVPAWQSCPLGSFFSWGCLSTLAGACPILLP